MDFSNKTDAEVLKIAEPMLDSIILGSNTNDYAVFTKDFSRGMLAAVTPEEFERQMALSQDMTGKTSETKEFLGCIYRETGVTVLWKSSFAKKPGEALAELTLDAENGEIKIFGAHIG